MSDTASTDLPLSWPRAGAILAVLAFAGTLGAVPSSDLPGTSPAMQTRDTTALAGIATMSTGEFQPKLETGRDARLANEDIPLMAGAAVRLSAYAPLKPTSGHYGTALKCLTQAVYYEAANESDLGKRAVAQVVLNRMRHPAYPNSVCGVVYQGANARVCQFSFTCDGALLRKPMARQWMQSRVVAAKALAGEQVPEVGSATHYHADYVLPKWAFTLGKIRQIDTHIFYRFPGTAGRANAFSRGWAGSEAIPALDVGRLRARLVQAQGVDEGTIADGAVLPLESGIYETGLTVPPDPTDRHAKQDVGGRLDVTTQWRLTIPDPAEIGSAYASTRAGQGDALQPGKPADGSSALPASAAAPPATVHPEAQE